jgi:hypothetical protein
VADRLGTRPRKSAEPRSVGMPAVSITSLIPTHRPCSGPGRAEADSRSARSRSSQAKARTTGSRSRMVAAQSAAVRVVISTSSSSSSSSPGQLSSGPTSSETPRRLATFSQVVAMENVRS